MADGVARRARARRAAQRGAAEPAGVAAEVAELARRDGQDAARMVPAADAVEFDTTGRAVGDVVDALVRLASSAAGQAP